MNVESTLGMLGIDYEEAGGEYRASCPMHEKIKGRKDSDPSWYINAESGLHICFAAETEVVTRSSGVRTIGSLAGGVHTLLTSTGWVDAPVTSFGYQRLKTITLTRNGVLKTIRATADHRWFVKGTGRSRKVRELRTKQLKPGHRLVSKIPTPVQGGKVSPWGAAHGIVFGDGTTVGDDHNRFCNLTLYGEKQELLRFFPLSHHSEEFTAAGYNVSGVRVNALPNSWKYLPPSDESRSYLYGWLAGLFATDGCVTENGTLLLSSADRKVLEFVRRICTTRLNIATYPIRSQERVGKGQSPSLMHTLPLVRSSLSEDFFLLTKHRARFTQSQERGASDRIGWQVVTVEDSGFEEVFCAVVKETGDFVLEDWILTGNCFSCGYKGNLERLIADVRGIDIGQAKALVVESRTHIEASRIRERINRSMNWVVSRDPQYLPESVLASFDDPPEWALLERGITEEACRRFHVRWEDPDSWVLPIRGAWSDRLMGYQVKSQSRGGLVRNRPTGVKKARTLFGLWLANESDEVWVVESPLDAVRLSLFGRTALATYGSQVSRSQINLLSVFDRVVLAFDNDDSGAAANDTVMEALRKMGSDVVVARYPKHRKDPGDCTDEEIAHLETIHAVKL